MNEDGWATNGMDEATGRGYGGVQRGGVDVMGVDDVMGMEGDDDGDEMRSSLELQDGMGLKTLACGHRTRLQAA